MKGRLRLLGQHWTKGGDDRALRERIGVQLQETQLAEKVTVVETLRLFRSFYQRGHDVDEVIHTVALEEKRNARVGKLSGGQKQRLAVACALVSDPELLFLDEPTTGLDPQARLSLWDIVEKFRAGGGTILLTTHYMEEATRLCDRVAIMDHGKMIALGTPAELIESLGADQIIEFSVTKRACRRAVEAIFRQLIICTNAARLCTHRFGDRRRLAGIARRNQTTAIGTRHAYDTPGDTRRRIRQFDRENAARWLRQTKLWSAERRHRSVKSQSLHPLVELTTMRMREFLREQEAVFWVFVFPVLMTFALGIAFRNTAPDKTPVAIEAAATMRRQVRLLTVVSFA